MKINRLLAIVVMFLNKDKISATELAEKCEFFIRTIMEALKNINGVLDDKNVEIAMEKVKSIIPYNKKREVEIL